MSTVSRTYTFSDGTTAYGSQVETEFSTLYTAWNNADSGATSWTTVKTGTFTATGVVTLTASSGNALLIQTSDGGGTLGAFIDNQSNTASSSASLTMRVAGTSAGDPSVTFNIIGGNVWSVGGNNSDSGKFKISKSANLGTNDYLTINSTGSVILNNAALATNATDGFLYMAACAGTPTGTPTAFTGRTAWIYDSSNNIIYVNNAGTWKKTAALT